MPQITAPGPVALRGLSLGKATDAGVAAQALNVAGADQPVSSPELTMPADRACVSEPKTADSSDASLSSTRAPGDR